MRAVTRETRYLEVIAILRFVWMTDAINMARHSVRIQCGSLLGIDGVGAFDVWSFALLHRLRKEAGWRMKDSRVVCVGGQTATGGVTNPSQSGNYLHGLGLSGTRHPEKPSPPPHAFVLDDTRGQEGGAYNLHLIYRLFANVVGTSGLPVPRYPRLSHISLVVRLIESCASSV